KICGHYGVNSLPNNIEVDVIDGDSRAGFRVAKSYPLEFLPGILKLVQDGGGRRNRCDNRSDGIEGTRSFHEWFIGLPLAQRRIHMRRIAARKCKPLDDDRIVVSAIERCDRNAGE